MSASTEISALEAQRGAKLEIMEGLHQRAADEGRPFTAEEDARFESGAREVESIDLRLAPLRRSQELAAYHAVPVVPGFSQPHAREPVGLAQPEREDKRGLSFARYAMALAAGKGNLSQSLEFARHAYGRSNPELVSIIKAAVSAGTTTDPQWAGSLVYYQNMADEFIDLLRPATIIGRMTGFRRVPFAVRIPRQTAGASVGWVGEGAAKPVSKLAFDAISIPFSKIAGIVAITEELARYSAPSAEALVRDDLVATISQFMDVQFIDPSIAANPAADSPASITHGAQTIPSSGATVDNVADDLSTMLSAVVVNGFPLRGLAWVMNSRTKISLSNLRNAMGVYAYPTLAANGTLLGYPVIDSASVPITAGTPPTTFIALVVPGEILLADDGGVTLDSSREAALAMSDDGTGALVSLWQNNLVGIRAERFCHWLRRREGCVVVLTGVEY
ncbi:phage major capsid protein [Cupriavidus metallidurans]|uniref:phage major capsid protein n=1 Tax=Cupriavidus metallidurans TaxID=119219 RepID=UPI000037C7C0|nr:phage major capsid protein [Cupriavidus metallidurans]QGS30204.1 phage major capsid protein [Cupriavidus metallidurans]